MHPLARSSQLELLDTLDARAPAARRDLDANLRDIRRANRWFGGTRAILRALAPTLDALAPDGEVAILDVATGSADIPLALAALAERKGWRVRIVASDLQPAVLEQARALTAARRGAIAVEQADALALPYADASFDIVTFSLALHHFEPEDAERALGELWRVARRLVVVNDLERCRAGLAGAWLFSRVLTRNRLTRHDAPLSVRRAYTPAEALALACSAGWRDARARRGWPFRFVLTAAR